MRNCLLLVIILNISIENIAAQNLPNACIKFGAKAGINYSNMNFNKGKPPAQPDFQTSWKTGGRFGIVLNVPLKDNLSLQSEYLYSQAAAEINNPKTGYRLNYLSMPVLLKYAFVSKVSVLAGPQLELLISGKELQNGNSVNITHETEERSVGVALGIEYELTKLLNLEMRYMNGFNHIGIGQRSANNVKEFKFEVLQLTIGIMF